MDFDFYQQRYNLANCVPQEWCSYSDQELKIALALYYSQQILQELDPNNYNIREKFCCTTDLCNNPKGSSPGTNPGGTVENSSSQVKIFRPFLIAFAIFILGLVFNNLIWNLIFL